MANIHVSDSPESIPGVFRKGYVWHQQNESQKVGGVCGMLLEKSLKPLKDTVFHGDPCTIVKGEKKKRGKGGKKFYSCRKYKVKGKDGVVCYAEENTIRYGAGSWFPTYSQFSFVNGELELTRRGRTFASLVR